MIRPTISKFTNFLLDLLFPKYCLGCQTEGFYICPGCFFSIELNKFSKCYICGRRTAENRICNYCISKTKLSGLLVAGKWENALLREAIHQYKYKFISDLSIALSQTLINYVLHYNKRFININNIVLIFTPLHRKRLSWRGFNQAELLARRVETVFEWPVLDIIERYKHTLPQVDISNQKERRLNIRNAFKLKHGHDANLIKNKIIIIIDDVCTTGATLEEIAKILKPLKPKEIWGLVLARG